MRCLALEYHDIVRGDPEASGFPGGAAATYKLGAEAFAAHLEAIARRGVTIVAADRPWPTHAVPVALTFDDGGVSAATESAPALERHGWPGHFFVTTGRIGTAGFLAPADISSLRRAGHVIGSHSCTHPVRFAALTREAMLEEWRVSRATLEDILGEEVRVASVPGGYFSRAVAETADAAGLRTLFTSEPTSRTHRVGDCTVIGRYTLRRASPAAAAAALAAGEPLACLRQWAIWNAKKIVKAAGAPVYLAVRERLLERRTPSS
ncbi:MAG TPA: polysaccharide deacetylase family protein [Gemmatimonadales bacterium]|nr:polysaccharide deacetylase family protein [Gemmatimonadales bacterium]